MLQVRLLRWLQRKNEGIFGVLSVNNFPVCCTLELEWKDNHPQVSCIPAGQYICKRVKSPHFGDVFEITNVPNRSHILFHGANLVRDLLGCVGLAEFYHNFSGAAGIANPVKGAAFKEFMERLKDVNEFELTIEEAF